MLPAAATDFAHLSSWLVRLRNFISRLQSAAAAPAGQPSVGAALLLSPHPPKHPPTHMHCTCQHGSSSSEQRTTRQCYTGARSCFHCQRKQQLFLIPPAPAPAPASAIPLLRAVARTPFTLCFTVILGGSLHPPPLPPPLTPSPSCSSSCQPLLSSCLQPPPQR